jgi:hypothetical protein
LKYCITISLAFLFFLGAKAQERTGLTDSTSHNSTDSTHVQLTKVDSIAKLLSVNARKFDSLNARRQEILSGKFLIDSLKEDILNSLSRIQKPNSFRDTIGSFLSQPESKLSHNKFTSLADSIKGLDFSHSKLSVKFDSLQSANPIDNAQGAISEKQKAAQSAIQKPAQRVNEKLTLLSSESKGRGNLPQNVGAPDLDLNAGAISNYKNVDLPLDDIKLDTSVPSLKFAGVESISDNLPKMPELELSNLGDASKLDNIGNITSETGKISELSSVAGNYSKEVQTLSTGDVAASQVAEEKIISALPIGEELSALKEQESFIESQQAELKSYKNPEEYKKQTLARAKKIITQNMALYETQLQESVKKASAYQSKLGSILNKRNDLPKKRDPLRRLRPFEKMVPGLTMQVQKSGAWLVDLNPSLRYRLTSYWSVGSGWSERVLIGKYSEPYEQVRVSGARAFTEVIIFKGFSARIDAENMSAFVPKRTLQDAGHRIRIWNYMAGLKKDFSFIPRVTGNVQFMYNVYSSNRFTPYPTRFNVRFGFEYPLQKRKNK